MKYIRISLLALCIVMLCTTSGYGDSVLMGEYDCGVWYGFLPEELTGQNLTAQWSHGSSIVPCWAID